MQNLLEANPALRAFVAAAVAVVVMLIAFLLFEPAVTHGVNSNQFTVNQEITSEISFLTQPSDVSMSTSIQGLTGGTAYGTTTFNVSTNDSDGYTVSISFSSTTAMQATGTTSVIPNYAPDAGAGNADYTFSADAGEAWFAYTVENETTATDIDATFKDNGSNACGSTGTLSGKCWYNKSDGTVAEQIVDSSSATAGTGATSSVTFIVGVGTNPSPALETGWYRATATLTANVK